MAKTLKYSFNVIAALAIPIYIAAGALLTANAFQATLVQNVKNLEPFDEIDISPTLGWVTSSLVAFLLILAAASQTVSPTWRKMDEWGHRLDNKYAKWKHGREYYLDQAYQLRDDANKLQHSAMNNISKISRSYKANKIKFQGFLEIEVREDVALLGKVENALQKCEMWYYKLSTADGSEATYFSARNKLNLASEKLDLACGLLMYHQAPISNYQDKHKNLGKEIIMDKSNISNSTDSIDSLEIELAVLVEELHKLKCFLAKEEYIALFKDSKVAKFSLEIGQNPDKVIKNSYQRRIANDSLLPTQLNQEENDSCVTNVRKKIKLKEACCPFFTSLRDKKNSPRNARMPNDHSDRADASLLRNDSFNGLPIAAASSSQEP